MNNFWDDSENDFTCEVPKHEMTLAMSIENHKRRAASALNKSNKKPLERTRPFN